MLFSINNVSLVQVFRAVYQRMNSLELIELSSINKVCLVHVFPCSNTGSTRDDPYWASRKNSLKMTELSSINKVSLVKVSSCNIFAFLSTVIHGFFNCEEKIWWRL